MRSLAAAAGVELLKARRSSVPWVTVLALTVAASFGGLVMFILQDQRRARAMGLLGAKASLAGGAADWPTYFGLLSQTIAVGGGLIFGLVVVWMFGREFSQHTVQNLLALPTARTTIVGGKFVVAAVWCLTLSIYTWLLGLLIGAALGLPGWSAAVAVGGSVRLLATAVMATLLVTPFALAASVGRGYLAGVGCMIAATFLAQVVALLGYGPYFPWSVPALFSGVAGPDRALLGPVGYTLVAVVGVGGAVATAAWWKYADQDR